MKNLKKAVSLITLVSMAVSLFAAFAVTAAASSAASDVMFSTKFDAKDDWTGITRFNTVTDSLYGNVMATITAGTAESKHYKLFDAPVTSGKIILSADIKPLASDAALKLGIVIGGDGSAEQSNGDKPTYGKRVLVMMSGKIGVASAFGNGVDKWSMEVTANTWYHADIVADMDAKTLTYYINGEEKYVFENALNGFDQIKGIFIRSNCTTDGTPTSYADNVTVLKNIGQTTYTPTVNDGYVDVEFTQAIKGLSAISKSDISISPVLGGDEVSATNVEVMGMKLMRVYFDSSKLVNGAEYMIVPKTPFNGVTGGTLSAVSFNAPSGETKTVYLPEENFSSFDGTTLPEGWEVKDGKESYVTVYTADNGNKALQINKEAAGSKNTQVAVTLPTAADSANKDITAEFKYYLNKAAENPFIRVYADFGDTTSIPFEMQAGTLVAYNNPDKAGDGYNAPVKGLKTNAWYTVKMTIHNNDTVDYYFYDADGALTGSATAQVLNNRTNIGGKSLTGLRFVHRTAGSDNNNDGAVYVDDVSVYSVSNPATISSVRFEDVDGNSLIPQSDGMTPGVKKVNIVFGNSMNPDTIDVDLIDSDNNSVSAAGEYFSASNTYALNLTECLQPNSTYTLTVGKAAEDVDGKTLAGDVRYTFATGSGAFRILKFALTDADGNTVALADVTAGTVLKLKAKIVNTSGTAQPVCLSYGVYNGLFLEDVDMVSDTLSGNNTYFEETLTFNGITGTNVKIKGFLWDSTSNLYPLEDCIELQ